MAGCLYQAKDFQKYCIDASLSHSKPILRQGIFVDFAVQDIYLVDDFYIETRAQFEELFKNNKVKMVNYDKAW